MSSARLLDVLDRHECVRLLGTVPFGRVVHTDRALPACTPVNFTLFGSSVVFRTTPHSRLAAATNDMVVAFQADDIDQTRRAGWSVLVTGLASAVRDVGTLVRLERLGLASWAGNDPSHWVRIALTEITGRRLVSGEQDRQPPHHSGRTDRPSSSTTGQDTSPKSKEPA